MRKYYHKLIRDHIPEIIAGDGKKFQTTVLQDEQYREALLKKVLEEAAEVAKSSPAELPSEIADLFEVVEAVMATYGITMDDIQSVKVQRRNERGGFSKKLQLEWVEE